MHCCIIHFTFIEERRRTLRTKGFILPHGDQMIGNQILDRTYKLSCPNVVHLHRKETIIEPACSFFGLVHILYIKINLFCLRNGRCCKIGKLLR
ncbi:hypothetical protein D3C74_390120 [compost metagenome]